VHEFMPGPGFASVALTIAALVGWIATAIIIAIAVRANWGVARHMPGWAVTLTIIAIGALLGVAIVSSSAWFAVAAVLALFALWLWFVVRVAFWHIPDVAERLADRRYKHRAERRADQAEQARRGDALEDVLGTAMRDGRSSAPVADRRD